MPFTPSHAVVALPFVRSPLLPAAIAVGAMTPDLPLFLRGTPLTYQLTHTNIGLAAVLALALLALWYLVLRPAAGSLAPAALARRLPEEWDASARGVWDQIRGRRSAALTTLAVAFSLVIGVVSHIAWDAFTHEGRWGVRLLPALAEDWGPLPGYKWVQHGSSVVGLVILGVFALRWLMRRMPRASLSRAVPDGVRRAWWLSLPVALIASWIWGLVAYGPLTASWTVAHLAYRVLPLACAVWGALTLILCLVVIVRGRSRPRRTE